MDAEILQAALTALAGGHRVFLVTVTAATGSTPQRPGAWMAVDERGRLAGTIGGGALEYACTNLAAEGKALPGVRHFSLNAREAGAVGMICGGSTDILFTPVAEAAPLQAALGALNARQDLVFCLPLDGGAPFLRPRAADRTGPAPVTAEVSRMELPILDTRRVFVIGGGVSKAGPFLIDQIRRPYEEFLVISPKRPLLGLATLGNDAGIYGAARMVLG